MHVVVQDTNEKSIAENFKIVKTLISLAGVSRTSTCFLVWPRLDIH
jgi:hypothetical protein